MLTFLKRVSLRAQTELRGVVAPCYQGVDNKVQQLHATKSEPLNYKRVEMRPQKTYHRINLYDINLLTDIIALLDVPFAAAVIAANPNHSRSGQQLKRPRRKPSRKISKAHGSHQADLENQSHRSLSLSKPFPLLPKLPTTSLEESTCNNCRVEDQLTPPIQDDVNPDGGGDTTSREHLSPPAPHSQSKGVSNMVGA